MASTKNETKKTAGNGTVNTTEIPAAKQEPDRVGTTMEKKPGTQESVYSLDELCNNAQALFGTMPECVSAALKEKGIRQCKKSEAEKIVRQFIKKEVK